jgi:type IV pilus assembly protein PilQ
MRAFKTVGFQVAIWRAVLAAAVAVGTTACAGSAPPSDSAAAPSEVVDVLVESSDGGTTITVVGPTAPVFTAYQMSDPERLVVDLANVTPGEIAEAIPVDDGRVEEIRVASVPEGTDVMTRVEVARATPSEHEVTAGPEGLVIQLTPAGSTADAKDPWAAPSAEEAETAQADEPAAGAWAGEPAEGEIGGETHPATVLSGIDARGVGAGTMIHLQSDGTVDSAQTFTLEDPARLVVDLPAIKNKVPNKTMEVGSPQVARVRVASHDDKVRVVIDGGSDKAPFEGRRVLPVASGLIVALGADPALDAEVASASGMHPSESPVAPAAPAAAAATAKAEPSGPVKIYGVEFDAQPERERVVVMAEQPVDYLVYEPDPETLILSIADATIAPEAAVRIVPEKIAAVSLVTAFAQPDVKRPEVRVVVKRAAGLKPEVSRQDAVLMMDFPNTGKIAAVPPAYAEKGADPANAAAPAAIAPGGAMLPAEPAAGAPPASIEVLQEGGLMDGKEYVGRRISLDFKEVDIADVLRLIAEVSDLNVIAGDEVKGKVTIRLVDEPWDQALDVILLTKGLGFARVGNVLRIAAKDVLAQEEELRLQERRAKEKLEDLVVKLQPVNYASVQDVSGMVKQLLTERGTVNIDKRTNTLIIKDIPSVIDEATALIKAVDAMTPQVMIEAKIVEAGLQYSRELGTRWTFGTNPLTEASLGGRDYLFHGGPDDGIADGLGNQVVFGNPITSSPTGVLGLAATVLDEKFNFEVELQAAEVNGEGKVISSPRVVTLDNSPAIIEQGVSIPFQTFENGDAQLEFVDAVLKLDVTPHITADGSIIMKIKVSRNAPDDSVATLDGTPGIAKNQVQTETLVKDGQTLVLGGIYVVDRSDTGTAVPYLSRLPFLGALFRSNAVGDNRKELLIFVSPRVVETQVPAAS